MFVEVHDGELRYVCVVELDGAIAAGCQQLVLVDLGPGDVVLGVICVEAASAGLASGPRTAPALRRHANLVCI